MMLGSVRANKAGTLESISEHFLLFGSFCFTAATNTFASKVKRRLTAFMTPRPSNLFQHCRWTFPLAGNFSSETQEAFDSLFHSTLFFFAQNDRFFGCYKFG